MDESQRRGGGGAATAMSKKPAAAAYGDAFAGAPRFTSLFSPCLLDYAEIFGDVAGSCSIPFLDLPPASDGRGADTLGTRGAGFDYSEVLGGLDFGEFAAPYEELFMESRRDECPIANGRRTKGEITSGQQSTEDLECSSKCSEGVHLECREGAWSDNDCTQFNRFHNKTNHGNKKGVTNGESHLPHAVPVFSPVMDTSTWLQDIGGDGPYEMLSDGVNTQKQHKKSLATSYDDDSKSSENYLRIHQKRQTSNYPVAESGHANTSHLNSSSNSISSATSNYAVLENGHANASPHLSSSSSCRSSAEVASSDTIYFSVSDISLRTQPLPVPPPSRAPPRLSNEKEHPNTRILSSSKSYLGERNSSNPDANEEKFHVHKDFMKDNSRSFFDVEVDISSAAAAEAAAAMSEAMELAEAKLRSAKQFMDKKRDIHQNRKKLVHQETILCKEQKLDHALTGKESFEENVAAKIKRKEASAPKLTHHFKGKEKVVVFSEEDGQRKLEHDMNSSKQSKSEDKSEKWKTNNEYHELINSEKSEVTLMVSEAEHLMKKTKIMTTSCEAKHNDTTKDALSCEIESRTLGNDKVTLFACVHENSNVEDHDSYEEVRKPSGSHNFLGQDVRDVPYAGKSVLSSVRNENIVNPSEKYKLHFVHDDKQETSKLEAALETCEDHSFSNMPEIHGYKEECIEEKGKPEADNYVVEKLEKEINVTDLTFDPSNDFGKLNVTNAITVQSETEMEVPHLSCISKIEKIEGDCKFLDSEDDWMDEKQHNAHNLNQLRRKEGVYEQVRSEELNMKPQLSFSAESEFRFKADQEANKLEENLRCEPIVGATTFNEQVKLMKTTEAVCWQDCNENRAKEVQLDAQQTEKKENNTPESCNLEKFEGCEINENDLGHYGSNGTIEIQIEPHFMEKFISVDAVPILCTRPLSMPLDLQPANLSGERSDMPIITTKCQPLASQNNGSDIRKKEQKEMERMEAERQQNEMSERRLVEEKRKEIIQEEEKTKLSEERKRMLRILQEDIETARSLEEAKRKEKKLEEEKVGASLFEANEMERKLKEEEQAIVLNESKERERNFEEVKEQAIFLETRESEKQVKEEHAMISQEEKERESVSEEAKENRQKLEDERTKLHTQEVKEKERISHEEDRGRLSEEAKENKQKLEDERTKLHKQEAKERERKLVERKEVAILLEDEKEREREREKDRVAVERAIREAHERAFAEAKERAERIAAERVTSEAWQRAFKEAQIKDKKASSETLQKSTDKASREARLRVERAAVERATAEARERAVERALAEKAVADSREHAQRHNSDRKRKGTVIEEHLKPLEKDGPHDARNQSTSSLSSYQASSTSNNQREGESVLRYKARLERHQRIAERAAKALAEKNMRDNLAQKEQAERNRLADYLDSDVKRWSNGKEGNLRALLSTLHYILGSESGWQPIPLTDVITASAIKKAYRKATLCVHPDKLQQRGATIQQKYICEKVFDLLKEAWNRCNSEERW